MPLPFTSAVGSNLCLCLFALGLVVSIHRASPVYRGEREPKESRAAGPVPTATAS
jgi:cell division protein FtsW (lipid II flippase)